MGGCFRCCRRLGGECEVSGGGFAEEVAESGEGGVSAGGAFCGLFGEAEVCVCLFGPDLFVYLGSADSGVWVGGDEGCEFGEVRSSADVGSFVECCHAWVPRMWIQMCSSTESALSGVGAIAIAKGGVFSAVAGVLLIDDSSAGLR